MKVWMILHKPTGLYYRDDSKTSNLSRMFGTIYRTKPSLDTTVGHSVMYGRLKVEGELAEEFGLICKYDEGYKTYVLVDGGYYGDSFEIKEYELVEVQQ